MALKPVQDPNVLAQLDAPTAPTAKQPVQDPALLAQLNADAPVDDLDNRVPVAQDIPQQTAAPEPSIWDKFLKASGLDASADAISNGDPIIDMATHGLTTIAKGAPEVAADMIGNTGVQAVAGLTAPFAPGDSADYVRDFTAENSMRPQGDSAKALTAGLGDAFAPLENVKGALGEGAEAVGAGPDAAATASMLPDFLMALVGGPKAAQGAAELPQKALKADVPVHPMVDDLRAADIRMRPSDVRAIVPDKKVKVPGEFRERFANAPELKKDQTLHNQARFTEMAAKRIGAPDLSEASLAKAKEAPAAVYDMVESVLKDKPVPAALEARLREALDATKLERPRGEVPTVTGTIGALRRRASKRINTDNVETEAAGYADRNMADALEEELGKALKEVGEPQLLKEYQDARKSFAQIHDVETATSAGQINADVLKRINKKTGKLSGELKLIADAAEFAPNVSKHSTTTAARAGGEIEGSKTGILKAGAKALIRKIPGMDVGSEGFQETLGKVNPARASYYGTEPDIAPARGPEQGGLDLREALDLQAPPGEVGAPRRPARELGPQVDALGNAFEFDMAPGEVGVPPEAPLSLQDVLGLGEPLEMKQPPGRVGKPKRKP